MYRKFVTILLSTILLLLTSCKEMEKNEIINDLKMAETLLPIIIDENTMCLDLYYDKTSNAVTIEYIKSLDSNTHTQTASLDSFLESLQANKEDDISKLLIRCANAKLNLHAITYSTTKDTLLDITLTPQEYAPQK